MSEGGRGRVTAAVLLAVVGGLSAAGGTAAPWIRFDVDRDIGGVPLPDVETIGGLALAPALLPLGLAAAVAGLGLLVTRGRVQQVLAGLVLVAGVLSGGLLLLGAAGAPPGGAFAAGLAFSGLGVLALVAAGALGLRPGSPARLPPRYDLEADGADDEWRLASDEEEGGDEP